MHVNVEDSIMMLRHSPEPTLPRPRRTRRIFDSRRKIEKFHCGQVQEQIEVGSEFETPRQKTNGHCQFHLTVRVDKSGLELGTSDGAGVTETHENAITSFDMQSLVA